MKGNIHHLGQEKQKKSNFLQLNKKKILQSYVNLKHQRRSR